MMNELEKAKKLLDTKSQNSISKATKLSQGNLSDLKSGKRDIEKARWITVHTLAQYYDKINSK